MDKQMKRFAVLVLALVGFSLAGCEGVWKPPARCPLPRIASGVDCFKCHVEGDFRVKETAADAHRVYPVKDMRVLDGVGYYIIQEISGVNFELFIDYISAHDVKHVVIEIQSNGGLVGEAQRIVGLMRHWQERGGTIETRLYGVALSAGFYVFVAGDVRLVDRYAYLMWHTVQFPGFVETPELVRAKKHIMKTLNTYLATRGKLTKEDLDKKVDNNEFWMSGKEAVKFGFATGLITK